MIEPQKAVPFDENKSAPGRRAFVKIISKLTA
jgi:hypothetical protein